MTEVGGGDIFRKGDDHCWSSVADESTLVTVKPIMGRCGFLDDSEDLKVGQIGI